MIRKTTPPVECTGNDKAQALRVCTTPWMSSTFMPTQTIHMRQMCLLVSFNLISKKVIRLCDKQAFVTRCLDIESYIEICPNIERHTNHCSNTFVNVPGGLNHTHEANMHGAVPTALR